MQIENEIENVSEEDTFRCLSLAVHGHSSATGSWFCARPEVVQHLQLHIISIFRGSDRKDACSILRPEEVKLPIPEGTVSMTNASDLNPEASLIT